MREARQGSGTELRSHETQISKLRRPHCRDSLLSMRYIHFLLFPSLTFLCLPHCTFFFGNKSGLCQLYHMQETEGSKRHTTDLTKLTLSVSIHRRERVISRNPEKKGRCLGKEKDREMLPTKITKKNKKQFHN